MINWRAIFNPETATKALPKIIEGLPYTLLISLTGFCIGILLGLIISQMYQSHIKLVRYLAIIHVSFMRGTPLMVLLFIIYYGLPFMNIQFDAITASILSFSIMSSAYTSEIIRSAFSAIDSGQIEAAKALGFSNFQILRLIRIPQAFRIAIPPLSNVLLDIIKSTSLTAAITVPEIFNKAKIVGGTYSDYMTAYICVAFIYWIISNFYAFFQSYLEKK